MSLIRVFPGLNSTLKAPTGRESNSSSNGHWVLKSPQCSEELDVEITTVIAGRHAEPQICLNRFFEYYFCPQSISRSLPEGALAKGEAMAKVKEDVVEIVDNPLEMGQYVDAVRDPGAGAISTFSGTTRDTFQGREVIELRYEAYKPMALLELKKICTSARSRWSLIGVAIAHRLGVVPIGEESVFIAVSSAHRKDALEACQFLIDELKATVPIWKKEVYSTGAAWKENGEFLERCQNRQ